MPEETEALDEDYSLCPLFDLLAYDFARDELSEPNEKRIKESFDEHLKICRKCRETLRQTQEIIDAVRSYRSPDPPN